MAVAICLITFSGLSIERNTVWRDSITLWMDSISKYPKNPVAHHNLGTAYSRLGRLNENIVQLLIVERLAPGYPDLNTNLAIAYRKKRWYDRALSE